MKTRHDIRRVDFDAPRPLSIEVMTFARLRELAPPGYLATPQRPAFHLLLLVTGGRGRHTVDFHDYALESGTALWVRPGQVQRFGPGSPQGDLVLFRADALFPGTRAAAVAAEPVGVVALRGDAGLARARRTLADAYAASRETTSAGARELLAHLLSVLVLELHRLAGPPPAGDDEGLYAGFRRQLERDFRVAHGVEHYARALGYSARTLDRATRAAGADGPKQLINQRLVLEARRLLAHTDQPVAVVAHRLGFRDAANFSSFFTRQTGEAPTRFRALI